jgi:hypothetical protein
MTRLTLLCSGLALLAGCVPQYVGGDEGNDGGPPIGVPFQHGPDGGPEKPIEAGTGDAYVDAGSPDGTTSVDAGDASDGGWPDGSYSTFPVLLAPMGGPPAPVDASVPFESHSVKVRRSAATSKLLLSLTKDGSGELYVDDNVHLSVTPTGGATADKYYMFWDGYPCPAQSTMRPPNSNGSGNALAIDVSFLFSTDTTILQTVTLEFWHCVGHTPAAHSDFYLIEQ